ncbi:methionine--tRNA ligase [bacterium]|nr:methionine--tRNA ligase [bacterium]MBU1065257.1 methionine--tRNA ligase [bacterium]MBU1633572.1 methionine--tRNA ligase [bacterium]MBU1872389.1 methionine--tRNA ligase [bacterium]
MNSKKTFYVTTPIYYVNGMPHIGHAYTTILADVLARFHRAQGDDVFFLTGVDEHGQKIQQAAEEAGIDPQEQCNRMALHFQNAWEKLEISHDFFMRTTADFHKKAVQDVLQDLWDKGEIYEHEYGGYYCVGCERFYTTKELVDGKCPQHLKEPEYIKEKNYFFRMSKYQDWLVEYINENPGFIQPETRKNEVLGFLKGTLEDLCISRPKSRLSWGIELPFDKDFVTYVWFDALLNYVTGIGYKQDEEQFNKWWPADYHLIGKDIVTTHCVYWPTMMKAAGIPMPKTIFAHGWWMIDETKMSKSLQNIVKPLDLIDKYGVDPVRYYLTRDMVLGQDSNFSEEMFIKRYNSDLANDFGNLASRIATLIRQNFDGKIPEELNPGTDEREIQENGEKLPVEVRNLIDELRLNEAIEAIMAYVRSINRYMEQKAPWKLVKSDLEMAGTVLYTAAQGFCIAAKLLAPVMPTKINEILSAFPIDGKNESWGSLTNGEKLGKFPILFPRIQPATDKPVQEKKMKIEEEENLNLISIDEFFKAKLVTAKVLEAEKVQGTSKLLKLQIDTGLDTRQIVAGIAEHYTPEQLIGKTIVVVVNLQPATIRGIESNGMLLAAKKGKQLQLITTFDDIEPGAPVG